MSNIINKILNRERVDRQAVFMVIDNFYYPSLLNNALDFSSSRQAILQSIQEANKRFAQDGLVIFPYPGKNINNFFGCKLEYNKYGTPLYVSNSINSIEDINKLKAPEFGDRLDIIEDVRKFSNDKFLTMPLQSPFELACILRGVNNAYLDLKKDPRFMSKIIDKSWELVEQMLRQYIEAGIENITIKNSLGSSSLISPAMYKYFSFSYDKKMVSMIHDLGATATLHVCKLSEPIIEMMLETKADILEIDSPNNINKIKDIVGDKVILKGNLDAVEDIFEGGDINLEKKLKNLSTIDALIISTGDSVPFGTKDKYINRVIDYFA